MGGTKQAWLDRWAEGRIGWHEVHGNAGLMRYWQATGKRVLVPLCGKSPDLLWLAERDNAVVGIELSEVAVEAFFRENALPFRRDGTDWHAVGRNLTIRCGDFFDFEAGDFDAHYDRGALIALPEERRPAYAARLRALLSPDCYQLIITLEYDQDAGTGPPFSVPAQEVRSYWPGLERLDARDDIDNAPPKFRDAGLVQMHEVVWRSGPEKTA